MFRYQEGDIPSISHHEKDIMSKIEIYRQKIIIRNSR